MPETQQLRMGYLALYRAAHNNAIDLLGEAEILFVAGKYPRAYALAFTALEEISKSQLAADVFTGFITEQEFHEHYRDHRRKIGRMAWATEDAKGYLDAESGDYVSVQQPSFATRMDAMYVRLGNAKVTSPSDHVGRDEAHAIIHTVRVALQRVYEMTEFWGHQIGTKGFLK